MQHAEESILEVKIEKGMKDEDRIVFEKQGDEHPGLPAGDIIFVLDEKARPFEE